MRLSTAAFLGLLGAANAFYRGFFYATEDGDCPSRTSDNVAFNFEWKYQDGCMNVNDWCDDRDKCAIAVEGSWISDSQDPPYSTWRCSDSKCQDCDKEWVHQGGKAPSKGFLLECAKIEGRPYVWIGG